MFAVIDLGTNTFHLVIVEGHSLTDFKIIHKESRFVRIAKDGVDPISDASLARARACLLDYKSILDKYGVSDVTLAATEWVRSATNGNEFTAWVHENLGFDVDVISGTDEAQLIFEGTIRALPKYQTPFLVMDIGGGSVEFIIGLRDQLLWSTSIKVGVQYLYNNFRHNDPITVAEINTINDYFKKELHPVIKAIQRYSPDRLVGASGSFETLSAMIHQAKYAGKYAALMPSMFTKAYDDVMHSTLEERYAHPYIPNDRAEMIVVGFLLIRFIYNALQPEEIIVSSYALREGLIFRKLI